MEPKKKRKSEGRKSLNNIEAPNFESDKEKLGFSPLTFVDNIVNSVHDIACDLVDDAENKLSKAFPKYRKEIENASDQFLDIWAPSLDRNFDKFEIYVLNNIFKIPNNIYSLENPELGRLKEINTLQEEYNEREKLLDLEINNLRQKIQESHYQVEILKEQVKYYDVKVPRNIKDFGEGNPIQEAKQLHPKLKELEKLIHSLPTTNATDAVEKQNIEETFLQHSQDVNVERIPELLKAILSDN